MDIDQSHLPDALEEMKTDSQNGTWTKFGKKYEVEDFCSTEQISRLIHFLKLPINLQMTLEEYKAIF